MKSVTNNEYTFTIKNSKFIGQVFYINEKKDVEVFLNMAKKKYPNATHYCYAYILDNELYANDDKEPTGTAGIPILQVLEKQSLNHTLCIVIRYFGKIKLGAGGLVRAYTKSCTEALKNHIIYLGSGYKVRITFSYNSLKDIDYFLKNKRVISKVYDEDITYEVMISVKDFEMLKVFKDINIDVIDNIYLDSLSNN